MTGGPARNPLAGRQRQLLAFLRLGLGATAGCAVVAIAAHREAGRTLMGDDTGDAVAAVMIGLLVGIPVVRIGWLLSRWSRRRDWRFALAAVVLLTVMVSGSVLAR